MLRKASCRYRNDREYAAWTERPHLRLGLLFFGTLAALNVLATTLSLLSR
jgi:hypothetical protein